MKFQGATYKATFDYARLSGQLRTIYDFMKDGVWRTPQEVAELINNPNVCSVDANLRNLRKYENGPIVMRRDRNNVRGLSEYRMIIHREYRDFEPPAKPGSLVEMFDKQVAEKNKTVSIKPAKEANPPQDLFYEREAI